MTSETGPGGTRSRTYLPLVYDELKGLARGYLRGERGGHTLQPTALVHEAYLRVAGGAVDWNDKVHFLAAAATAMRRVLVDHARRRGAGKREGAREKVTLGTEAMGIGRDRDLEILELDDLLNRLAALDARKAKVVELRFFAGLGLDEVATALDVARSTVAADWAVARAWLASELGA